MYELWTDGSCKANGTDKAVGAWGYILKEERGIIAKDVKAEKATTNNRMEMISIIEGIEALKKAVPNFGLCLVHSDSAYVMNCFVQKWYRNWKKNGWVNSKKEPVKIKIYGKNHSLF
jgi:Ribonuclease HI